MPESRSKWLVQLTVQQLTGMTLMAPFSPTQHIMRTPFANNKRVNDTDCMVRGSGVCAHVWCAHVCAKDELSVFVRVRVGFVSGSIYRRPATFTPTTLDTTLLPHPLGLLSWQLDRTAIIATSGYGVPCGLPGAPWWPFYSQGAQQPLIPGLSGVDLANWTICTHF